MRKLTVENEPFCALAPRVLCHEVSSPFCRHVICHEVSSPSRFLSFWRLNICYGNHFAIKGRQKATF